VRPYPKTPLKAATIRDLAWMSGRWVGDDNGVRIEEIWSPIDCEIMMGMFRWLNGDVPSFYEFMLLRPGPAGIELQLKHFGADLVGWEEKEASTAFDLVQVSVGEAVFVPRAEGSSGWAVYRIDEDGLLVFEEVSEKERSDSELSLRFAPSPLEQSTGPSEEEAHA